MKQQPLNILTFNILHGATTEGNFDLDRIAGVIRAGAPDLVALQEVDVRTRRARGYDLATELAQRASMTAAFARAMEHDGGEYGEAVLSRFSFESTRRIPLPHSEGNEPRVALQTTLLLPDGQRICFLGTHLDHASESDRESQAMALSDLASKLQMPAILAGDFNATPDSRTIEILKEHWTVAGADNVAPTYPSNEPEIKIDYIFFAPANRWQVRETRVIQDPVASDHCAFWVSLELKTV